MIYQGRELVELKFDTMQHWPEGRELLVWDYEDGPVSEERVLGICPGREFPVLSVCDMWAHAAERPTVTKRRVTRAECAGMAVKHENGEWESFYSRTLHDETWNDPIPSNIVDRAHTLADALAGRTLGMEVEG